MAVCGFCGKASSPSHAVHAGRIGFSRRWSAAHLGDVGRERKGPRLLRRVRSRSTSAVSSPSSTPSGGNRSGSRTAHARLHRAVRRSSPVSAAKPTPSCSIRTLRYFRPSRLTLSAIRLTSTRLGCPPYRRRERGCREIDSSVLPLPSKSSPSSAHRPVTSRSKPFRHEARRPVPRRASPGRSLGSGQSSRSSALSYSSQS